MYTDIFFKYTKVADQPEFFASGSVVTAIRQITASSFLPVNSPIMALSESLLSTYLPTISLYC